MRLLTVFLTLVLTLTACAISDENKSPPTTPTVVSAKPTIETSLLVTQSKGSSEGNLLFPLDPVSGKPLPNYPPISLGYSSFHAFSPDRRTLAVISFPGESAYNGSLLLIDLPAWKTQLFELDLTGWVNSMVFSPDGRQLAIAYGESTYKLTIINVEKGNSIVQEPLDSFVSRMKFTESGDALMLYSQAISTTDGMSSAPPQVLLLDAADLTLRWAAELKGVRDGIFPKDETVTPANLYEPGQAVYLSPGVVFAPDRNVLYIVHADSEQLTTVDFNSQEVKTVEIQAQLSWFERLLSLTAGVAYAKAADGTSKQAVLSPDGQLLYVIGVNNTSSQDEQGNWEFTQTPLGMEIIQTSDGSRVERMETDATDLSISPDGHFLYLRNWGNNPNNIPWTDILDATNRQIITRETELAAMPALLMNGEFLLVSTYSTSEYTHYMNILRPDDLSMLSNWIDTEYVDWLTVP